MAIAGTFTAGTHPPATPREEAGLAFNDPAWRHLAICRECTSEGKFATAEERDEWMGTHEERGWRHRQWRTATFT